MAIRLLAIPRSHDDDEAPAMVARAGAPAGPDHKLRPAWRRGARQLRYRFGDLAGVAFGAKMAHADKLEIMRIIDRKAAAEGRSDFEFYQAGDESRTGDVALHRLSLLRFTTWRPLSWR